MGGMEGEASRRHNDRQRKQHPVNAAAEVERVQLWAKKKKKYNSENFVRRPSVRPL